MPIFVLVTMWVSFDFSRSLKTFSKTHISTPEERISTSPPSRQVLCFTKENGDVIEFDAIVRLDTPVEVDYYRNGGILQTVLRNVAEA